MREVVLDFETISALDLRLVGAWRYAEDPTTTILCLTYTLIGSEPRLWIPGTKDPILDTLVADPNAIFVAHNASFEKAIWRKIMVPDYGFADKPNSQWDDTMAACAQRVIPQDLGQALQVLGLAVEKDKEGLKLVKSLSKIEKRKKSKNYGNFPKLTPEILRRVYAYNLTDIQGTVALRQRLGPLSPDERGVWLLDQRINERGVKLDLPFVRLARAIVERASQPLSREFSTITGGLGIGQTVAIAEWVRSQGIAIPNLQKETLVRLLGETEDGEEVDDDPGELYQELPENVRRALSIRQLIGSASVKKLSRMEACVSLDGRARGLLAYHGAGPGRWAGRLLQPQNFPRGTTKLDDEAPDPQLVVDAIMTGDPSYVENVIGPPVETVVSALRYSLVPDRGRLFVSGDFSTIEARVVLALAGQQDKLDLLAKGKDIYIDMANAIYGRTDLTKKNNPQERQNGKNSVLGLGFQMGWPKFKLRYAKDQPDEFCQRIVKTYREEWAPFVPKVWAGLEGAAWRTVHDRKPHEAFGVVYNLENGWLTARLPSGRKLWYFDPQPTFKAMPWDETDVRPAWTYKAKKLGHWRTIDAFGGLLTENVVQALARDLLVTAMFKAEKNGFPIVLTVHDEIVAEPEGKCADALALEQIMCDSPLWARELHIPVAVERWVGDRYRK
jgi:DNA polymerase bacteriophage-type